MYKRYDFISVICKLCEALIGFCFLLPLSYITPRNSKVWIFGSHIKYSGNPKYLFLYVKENCPNIIPIWITKDREVIKELRSRNLRVYYKWSLRGLYYSLIGGVYFFSFYTVDINYFTVGRAVDFNLWHGIGIKLIEFNVKNGEAAKHYNVRNPISRVFAPYLFRRPRYLLSTSQFTTDYLLKDAFRVPESKCIEIGYPRTDLFFKTEEEVIKFIKENESKETELFYQKIRKYSVSYIYMPTWRETRHDFITSAGFDFNLLNESLVDKDAVMVLKLHHATKIDLHMISQLSNIIVLDHKVDVYSVLPFIDVLITDYSSIYHDFMLLRNKQIILFPFDKEEYIAKNRGITLDPRLDYDEYTLGVRAYTFKELLELILNNDKVRYEYPQKDWLLNLFWNKYNGAASEQIVHFLKKELCIKNI